MMSLSSNENERVNHALKRVIIKWDATVTQMQVLYELSLRGEREKDVLPLFRASKKDVDTCQTQFSVEQGYVLNLLLQLERKEEYLKKYVPLGSIFTEQYYLVKSVSETFGNSALMVSNSTAIGSQESLYIHLPKIQLPSFNSDILQ